MSRKQCETCSYHLKDLKTATKNYYLGRPLMCWGDEEFFSGSCTSYSNYEEIEYGERNWTLISGEIVPNIHKDWNYDTWFRRGFNACLEVLESKQFVAACNNCEHSNRHIYNYCKDNKDALACDRYKLDYLRLFDKAFYGNLCDSCITENCIRKDPNILVPTNIVQDCEQFVPKEEI